ncbi:hypothetical protein EW026_g6703 [Hermanssonia centrifuga]|uniref:Uncharacterized protein n=1 Tax=Hermanssonia centrifuga TaxID=98765 RepID=A0A4S4KBX6_9APHY|nr:hypothetical protein EW026_g6703 [Hermanssonia centrifuga]
MEISRKATTGKHTQAGGSDSSHDAAKHTKKAKTNKAKVADMDAVNKTKQKPKAQGSKGQLKGTDNINDGNGSESCSGNESKLSGEDSSSYAPSKDDNDLRAATEQGDYAVKEKFQREKPQWVRPLVIADDNEGVDVDDNGLMNVSQLPIHCSRSRRSSTPSGGAPPPSSPGESNDNDNETGDQQSSAVIDAKSRREKAVEAEHPRFKKSETQKGLTVVKRSQPSAEPPVYAYGRKPQHKRRKTIDDTVEGELQWPAQTRLAYVSVNKINKKDQSTTIQRILTQEIIDFTVDFSFMQAIYRANDRIFYQQKLAVDAARQLGYGEAASRLQEDLHYAKVMIDVIALALLDWDSGRYMPAREFNIAYAERVYRLAIDIMHYIKDKSINMYHRVMHKVYGNVCARLNENLSVASSDTMSAVSHVIIDDD